MVLIKKEGKKGLKKTKMCCEVHDSFLTCPDPYVQSSLLCYFESLSLPVPEGMQAVGKLQLVEMLLQQTEKVNLCYLIQSPFFSLLCRSGRRDSHVGRCRSFVDGF